MIKSALLMFGVIFAAGAYAENLLENSGFESDLESWSTSGAPAILTNSTDPAPFGGSKYLYGATEEFGVWQDIDLIASGVSQSSIDQGGVMVKFGGMQAGYSPQEDYGQITLYLYDESMSLLNSHSLPETHTNSTWVKVVDTKGIAVGTRFLRYEFVGRRVHGSDNDAYLDGAFAEVALFKYLYIDQVMLKDMNGNNYSELAVLRQLMTSGRPQVFIKDSSTKRALKSIAFFGPAFTSFGLTTISDINGNSVDEIAVLAIKKATGAIQVQVKDADTKGLLKTFSMLSKNYTPLSISSVSDLNGNGIDEVAVLAKHNDSGKVLTQIKDASTGELVKNIPYPK